MKTMLVYAAGLRRAAPVALIVLAWFCWVHALAAPSPGEAAGQVEKWDPSKRFTAAQQNRTMNLRPLVWVHIPKTGSSFFNVLIHRFCPGVPSFTMEILRKWNIKKSSKLSIVFREIET